jgi:exosortase/archaeosortase family protein
VGIALLFGVVMFLLGSLWRAGYGPSQPGTLAITLGAIGIIFPLIFLHAPDATSPAPANARTDARVRLTLLFLFPVLVWLISAPLVSVLESELNLFLLRKIVTVVAFVFDVLGLPIEQRGNVLALPTGDVGVAEACSGIRSLTGCLFAGSFLAAVFVQRPWKKLALVVTALALALGMNLVRSLFLTAWAYRHGPAAIEGTIHDAAGYAVLGFTVVGLLVFVKLLNWPFRDAASPTR